MTDASPRPNQRHLSRREFAGLVGAGAGVVLLPVLPASAASRKRAARLDATTGSAWTSGGNPNGQLGDGTTTGRTTFGVVPGHGDFAQTAGGREHVLALDSAGGVWAWGDNARGQVGNGTKVDAKSPTKVTTIALATAVATGHYHSMALLPDSTVECWGLNANGQLGDGSKTLRTRPVAVAGLSGVQAIRGGRDMSMALDGAGAVWVWGLGTSGQLGDGTTNSSTTPVKVPSLSSGVAKIAAGRDHLAAVKDDGSLWMWGNNTVGEVGDGTTVMRTAPVHISLPADVVQVELGAEHSVALLADGTVYCWGKGTRGALGTGGTARKLVPTKVAGALPAIGRIGAGRDHTLAASTTGALWVWGFNDAGQLGDGSTTNRLSPKQVSVSGTPLHLGGGRNYSVILLG
ncbi:MAG: RCC1 domain-containing protein [Actinomycetales bacterium]